jgi:hypothetical protein
LPTAQIDNAPACLIAEMMLHTPQKQHSLLIAETVLHPPETRQPFSFSQPNSRWLNYSYRVAILCDDILIEDKEEETGDEIENQSFAHQYYRAAGFRE